MNENADDKLNKKDTIITLTCLDITNNLIP